jgi:hypothetical protein
MTRRQLRTLGFIAALLYVCTPFVFARVLEYWSEQRALERMNERLNQQR